MKTRKESRTTCQNCGNMFYVRTRHRIVKYADDPPSGERIQVPHIKCLKCGFSWADFDRFDKFGILKVREQEILCETAKRYIRTYFAQSQSKRCFSPKKTKADRALERAFAHMVVRTSKVNHVVVCSECWAYYTRMKQKHCKG